MVHHLALSQFQLHNSSAIPYHTGEGTFGWGGRETVATHFRCVLPQDAHSGSLTAEFVREFPSLRRVEGMAVTPEGRTFYVTDEGEGVHLRLTRLLAG